MVRESDTDIVVDEPVGVTVTVNLTSILYDKG